MSIKKMDVHDLDEVLKIENSSSMSWSKNMFIEEMQNPLAHCFVINRKEGAEERVMGFICFRNVEEESELLKICVHPEYRQRGIAKRLMHFYIQFCKREKIKAFYLEVDASNQAAVRLYQSFSYEPLGLRKRFFQGKSDALLMVRKA